MKECKCRECRFHIDPKSIPPHASFLIARFDCSLNMLGIECIDGHRFEQDEELVIIRKNW